MDARLGRVVCANKLSVVADKRAITIKTERIKVDLLMMDDDCKRERLGLKAQTRIPMHESGSGLPYVRYALACRDVTNRVQRDQRFS